jgi:hypothetical protein
MGGRPLIALLLASLGAAGCLPDDNRPTPGSVQVNVEGSEELLEPVASADGWTITVERLLVGLGTVELHGTGCTIYDQAYYSRLFDFAVPLPPPHKLALVYGLGDCTLEFRMRAPHPNAVLGPGVQQADIDAMRIELYTDYDDEPQRASVWVRGRATREDVEKQFEWEFRRRYNFKECPPGPEGQPGSALPIAAGDALEQTVVVDGSELFRVGTAEDEQLEFEPFSLADADGDGEITLDELAEASAPAVMPAAEGAADLQGMTLAEHLYDNLVPQMVSLAGAGKCNVELDDRRW